MDASVHINVQPRQPRCSVALCTLCPAITYVMDPNGQQFGMRNWVRIAGLKIASSNSATQGGALGNVVIFC